MVRPQSARRPSSAAGRARTHTRRWLTAEVIPQLLELIARGGGLLPCVVEQSRGDHRVRLSGVIEQLGHCQGMGDERYVIAIAQLPLVACGGKPKRCLR